MGYTTDFRGRLEFDKVLTNEQVEVINKFNEERHEPNVEINYPGYWCQWRVEDNGLEWDGGEKFYNYVEWLEFLIKHYFEPWGVKLNGEIDWFGEDNSDMGRIKVTDNVVKVQYAQVTFGDEQ